MTHDPPQSILDNDLYKFTMQQAVMVHYPHTIASYKFTNRNRNILFSKESVERFKRVLSRFSTLRLSEQELSWLKANCSFFRPNYLEFLSNYRFDPSQVSVKFTPTTPDGEKGDLDIDIQGLWVQTILWEVPIMANLSEIFFKVVDTDWSYEEQEERAYEKAKALLLAECTFSEFGTRRRRSYQTQDLVMKSIVKAEKEFAGHGKVVGTSNVHFAQKYGYKPVGTIAHEWFMGVAALSGYKQANHLAMDLWEQIYPPELLIALTDTFSTRVFFQDFGGNPERAKRWKGLRQDSGDPFAFAPRARQVYESLGVDHHQKLIVYSDALDVDRSLKLKINCEEQGFIPTFGIGTFFTNDYASLSSGGREKSKALNMVIKLSSIDGRPCVKISDDLTKNTGDEQTVKEVKGIFGLPLAESGI